MAVHPASARLEDGGSGLFAVKPVSAGFTLRDYPMLDDWHTAEIEMTFGDTGTHLQRFAALSCPASHQA